MKNLKKSGKIFAVITAGLLLCGCGAGGSGVNQQEQSVSQPEQSVSQPEESVSQPEQSVNQPEQKTQEDKQPDYTEDNLKEFLYNASGSENYLYFYYDDFNGDGKKEAFGVTGDEGDSVGVHNNVKIYYVSSEGNVVCMNPNLYGYPTTEELLTAGNSKFFLWEASGGGSGSITYVYGVKDGQAYEPEVSGCYMCFGTSLDYMGITGETQPEGTYVGFTSDFSKGYHDYIPSYFLYDENSGEFTLYR